MKNKVFGFKVLSAVVVVLIIVIGFCVFGSLLSGCAPADKVNYNLKQEARSFHVERRIVVYNARTDKIILEIEGFINIENTSHDELMITAQTGPDEYRKN